MTPNGQWVYQEMPERQGFSLCRVIDAGTADEAYDLLGVVEIVVDRRAPQRPADALRGWALATLTAGGYRFGRYLAEWSTLDDDGEPDRFLGNESIAWSGETVLTPAG